MASLGCYLDFNYYASNANQGGKLWVFWNIPNIFEIVLCTTQSVSGWFKWDAHRVFVTFVYAKCSYVERRELWHDLEEWTVLDQPWLVLGDFNVIRRDSERVGGNPRPFISMLEFNDCIDRCGLLEVSSSGQRMSWCNGHGGVSRSWAKLDRVLMNNFFASIFPSVHFNYLSRKSSDHCPMVVCSDHTALSYGPSPFRFLNMWCSHDGFLMCVKEAWNQQDTASGLLKLSIRLKRTKIALRAWNKNVFGRVDVNIRALEERLEFLDTQLQSSFSEEIEDDFVATKTEIDIWEKREASRLAQIAKKKWLTEGDQNSKFFHSVINQRHNKGHISKMVLADGRVLCTAEEVHEEAVIYFRNFLSDVSTVDHCDLSRIIEKKISDEENLWLCAVPSELEVKQAVFSIPKNSSPGPDGFGSGFYMSCWDIIKEDVVAAAGDFFRGVPLSRAFGFSDSVCQIIANCVQSQWFSVMMNGTLKGFFQSARGLRQGDPLSPYLFILMEEVLSRLLRSNFQDGRIGKFSHPIGAPLVSHLLYADDILIFTNGGKRSITNLLHTLDTYERWSGQKINRDKSALFLSKLISNLRKRSLLSLTGFKEANFFWGENDGKRKYHWRSWRRICVPTKDGGLGMKDLKEVQKSLHMKFAFRILSSNNLWSDFFRAKYIRHSHFSTYKVKPTDSRFWRSLVKVLPEVMDNVKVLVRGGNASFWFDRWLASGPLSIRVDEITNNRLRLQDCWSNNSWDEDLLRELVSEEVVEEIIQMPINVIPGPDLFVWKPSTDGRFSTRTAWEVVRKRGQELPWHDWFWHQLLPKRISICLWKIWFNCLPVDVQVQSKGVSLASACDCCERRCMEDIDHIFSMGAVAFEVWLKASTVLGIPCSCNLPWKNRVAGWFSYAKKSSFKGTLVGLIPCIITWCLWKRRCKARMDGKYDSAVIVWRSVRVWIQSLANNINSVSPLSMHDLKILEDFNLERPHISMRPSKIVKWSRPPSGWVKLNCDGSCRGNPGNSGGVALLEIGMVWLKGLFLPIMGWERIMALK
ncbi:uncharacterized protein LOC118344262 [Juglans regia]|uniref:Uncharacterized protein LOC118344262 n=1 Tax=Juglans regia TaxID=51240 RepID=A0A6P9E7U1_JUGRE|nr:uncharacterized protein LOC118344262 [Juglans regia]